MDPKPDPVRRAADLLRAGATMMAETCPTCGSPLFKFGSEIKCAECDKKVVIVRGSPDEAKVFKASVLESTEQTLLIKVQELQTAISREKDPEVVRKLAESLADLLGALEKIRRD